MERIKKKRVRKVTSPYGVERAVKEELVRITNVVRNKYKGLKEKADSMEEYFKAKAKPIVEPLQKTVEKSIKEEFSLTVIKSESTESTQTEESTNLVQKYLKRLSSPLYKNRIDSTYGVRADGSGGTVIGDSKVTFTKLKLFIRNKQYGITQGLLELLFMQVPNKAYITQEDLTSYKDILTRTNAHKQMYSADRPINANKGKKYTTVISVLFPTKTSVVDSDESGAIGMGIYNTNINRLVDRLRLLVMSKSAGHTGHNVEIDSIINTLVVNKVIA